METIKQVFRFHGSFIDSYGLSGIIIILNSDSQTPEIEINV